MPSITGSLIAAGVGAAGAIGGSLINSGASTSAANTESNAATNAAQIQAQSEQSALNQQLGIYNNTVSNLAPYLNTGTSAFSQLSSLLGIGGNGAPNTSGLQSALQNYPGYQFAQQQGLEAVNASGAARGVLNSGATIKDATAYGQDLASSTLQNYLAQLQSTASLGESAGTATGNIGANTGSQIGNTLTQGGTGQANSLIAAGNAAGSGQLASALQLTGGVNQALNSSLQGYLAQQGGINPVNITGPNYSALNQNGYLLPSGS